MVIPFESSREFDDFEERSRIGDFRVAIFGLYEDLSFNLSYPSH